MSTYSNTMAKLQFGVVFVARELATSKNIYAVKAGDEAFTFIKSVMATSYTTDTGSSKDQPINTPEPSVNDLQPLKRQPDWAVAAKACRGFGS
jgi:hypothetical protein